MIRPATEPLRTATLRLRPVCALVLTSFAAAGAFAAPGGEQVAQVQFNEAFVQQFGALALDVKRFDEGNTLTAGSYRADLYVNGTWLGRAPVTLRETGPGRVEPCFDRELLERAGVNLTKLAPDAAARLEAGANACVPLPQLVPDATASFDNGEQRLDISVPQVALSRLARGYVDPKFWDEGVTSGILQYNASGYHSAGSGGALTQGYVGLTAGLNMGPWRFRHNGNLASSSLAGTHYQDVQTSLTRSIGPLKSQLVMGDAFTDGTMFDSVGFRGVQLASDDRMYPESQRGYAPVIHGIARSNAHVQVLQNGNVLYETNVAPGPFEIDDLYATGYGGNLQVVVTEADGTQSTSLVPYAPAANALRPGVTRYTVTAGEYRSATLDARPPLFQATVQHGFTNLVTGYGGVTVAEGYFAAVAGAALNTPYGAVGLDITQAGTKLRDGRSLNGQSVRLSYSKLFSPTGTNLAVAAYRFSERGYLGLDDAMAVRATGNLAADSFGSGNRRNNLQLTLNQTLPAGYGSFYLTGLAQDYWNHAGTDTQFQAGYSNNFRRINYGVSASRQYEQLTGKWDNRLMLTLSVPLGIGAHAPSTQTSVQRDSDGATSIQEMMSGTLGVDNRLSYGVNAGYNGGAQTVGTASAGGNVSYRSPLSTLTASASGGRGASQFGAGASGSVVAYGGGVVFSPATGDTMAIVEAKDAEGARVASQSGLRVDRWGHALVPGLTPFADNEIEIDPKGLPVSVELKSTSQHVAPTAGAVVRTRFETDNPGASLIIRARTAGGEPVPFGADVFDAAGHQVGTVAQAGQVMVRGLKTASGELAVRWAEGTNRQQCRLTYSLPATMNAKSSTWTTIDAACEK